MNSYPNICDIYCSNCKSINHNLVDLEQYLHEINKIKKSINPLSSKRRVSLFTYQFLVKGPFNKVSSKSKFIYVEIPIGNKNKNYLVRFRYVLNFYKFLVINFLVGLTL